MNQVILVGRLKEEPQVKENDMEKKVAEILLEIPRSFKNVDGEYENDFIKCILWNGIAANTSEYCHVGDTIGVKGRLQSKGNELEIIAERVSFVTERKRLSMDTNFIEENSDLIYERYCEIFPENITSDFTIEDIENIEEFIKTYMEGEFEEWKTKQQ